jgi:hypothetical protein
LLYQLSYLTNIAFSRSIYGFPAIRLGPSGFLTPVLASGYHFGCQQ